MGSSCSRMTYLAISRRYYYLRVRSDTAVALFGSRDYALIWIINKMMLYYFSITLEISVSGKQYDAIKYDVMMCESRWLAGHMHVNECPLHSSSGRRIHGQEMPRNHAMTCIKLL